jgi:paraquat-inducible protein A
MVSTIESPGMSPSFLYDKLLRSRYYASTLAVSRRQGINKSINHRVTRLPLDSNLNNHYQACPYCDLLLPAVEPPTGHSVICPRCGAHLRRYIGNGIIKSQALSLTGLLLYFPAIFLPLMTLESFGFSDSANILQSIVNFYQNQYHFVAFMVLLSAVLLPVTLLTLIFTISTSLLLHRSPRWLTPIFRWFLHLEEWAMVEVYLLGILITVIKMGDSSAIEFKGGLLCFGALVFITIALSTTVDEQLFWNRIDQYRRRDSHFPFVQEELVPLSGTAAANDLILCHVCHLLAPIELEGQPCPRCHSTLHLRKPNGVARTWALVVTAAILLIPANVLPIMQVEFLGVPDRSTIMDGIIYFFQHGSILIGLIIFCASILVPVFKIMGLTILLMTNKPCGHQLLRNKAKMFRFIAFIGRWSMLDIFVIALLTVLVDFGFFSSIHAAPAATYFCMVVVTTMFGAITFDPRTIWDKCSVCNETIPTASNTQYHNHDA